jgi:predicted nucleic acid-binding protein
VIVVDSSVWIGFFAGVTNRQTETLLSIPDRNDILVGDIVLLEVLRGTRSERIARNVEDDLRRFGIVAMLNTDIALKAAQNYRLLRAQGVTIRTTVDLIIATYCIEHRHRLLHRDRDFDHMQSLGLEFYLA